MDLKRGMSSYDSAIISIWMIKSKKIKVCNFKLPNRKKPGFRY